LFEIYYLLALSFFLSSKPFGCLMYLQVSEKVI